MIAASDMANYFENFVYINDSDNIGHKKILIACAKFSLARLFVRV